MAAPVKVIGTSPDFRKTFGVLRHRDKEPGHPSHLVTRVYVQSAGLGVQAGSAFQLFPVNMT